MRLSRALCCAAAVGVFCAVQATDVAVDLSKTYQTIEGFGAFLGIHTVRVKDGPFYVEQPFDPQYDTIAHHLGASMMRTSVPVDERGDGGFQPTEGGPYQVDAGFAQMLRHVNGLKERGITRFISSCWSPPKWMKDNNSVVQGGHLKTDMYDDLARYFVAFVDTFKARTGLELYALSVQNEPYFVEPYASCVYTAPNLGRLIRETGAAFRARGHKTKIFGPEDMGKYDWNGQRGWFGALLDDASTLEHLGAYAVHGYLDGIQPDGGTASGWSQMYTRCTQKGKPLWMSETTGRPLMETANNLHVALKHGKVSAWTWWSYGDNLCQNNDQPNETFYASKHWFRFVRPGAKMVDCNSSLGSLWATAFKHEGENTVTIVFVNNGGATTVNLSGSGLPADFEKYETAGTSRCQKAGTVSSSGDIAIAASSITTLYSGTITGVSRPRSARRAPAQAATARVRVYSLDGRIVTSRWRPEAQGQGKNWQAWDEHGRPVAAGRYVRPVHDGR